jgi:predicted nucleic-acid-binding protein
LRSKELVIADATIVWKALHVYRDHAKADFPDNLIACLSGAAGCSHTVTFDQGAAKACGMKLIA